MLFVTQAAYRFLGDMIDKSDQPQGTAVRIVARGERLGTAFDTPQAGDATVEDQGRVVLLLDASISDRLAERILDVEPEGESLLLA